MTEDYFKRQLKESLGHGFVDPDHYKNDLYAPKILTNHEDSESYILTDIQDELRRCQHFRISVAFLNSAGINMLKADFHDLALRGGSGQIIISPYLGFNQPHAMRELLKLKNVHVRLAPDEKNLHAKFYCFERNHQQILIVGSANLTGQAFKQNFEWNVKLNSTENGSYVRDSLLAFEKLWAISTPLTENVIQAYETHRYRTLAPIPNDSLVEEHDTYQTFIHPNAMQKQALQGLQSMRHLEQERALVISATGTGKTYLAAFDVRNYKPKRFLFLVHREQILRKAQQSFQKVIGFDWEESAIYESRLDVSNKKYIFATIQSLSRPHNLNAIARDCFDYILIDEVHRAGAPTYQRIMDYFQPDFCLGMTATPERSDDYNIYQLFDYNVAYEIRLHQALEEDMLCPFIYYGVSDLIIDQKSVDESTSFNDLTSDQRVSHIHEKIQYYKVEGVKTKGLIFCSSVVEAHDLSHKLNQLGYRCQALSGQDPQDERERVIKGLELGRLDYILTVDIFNEGVDIPSLNQIIMLRHTESAIIFVQQLGRGLRKHPSKEFVTIIDFIGNYKNNYMIPIALYGDSSYDKDNYRRKIANRVQLAGLTTINFEEIASQHIFKSIGANNLSTQAIIKEKFLNLQNRLGRSPYLIDFLDQEAMDPLVIFKNKNFKHYGQVLNKFSDSKPIELNNLEEKYLNFMTQELLNGKRPHELLMLALLLESGGQVHLNKLTALFDRQQIFYNETVLNSVKRILDHSFYKPADQEKYGHGMVEFQGPQCMLGQKEIIQHRSFMDLALDVIKTGLKKSQDYPAGWQAASLEVGRKYTRKDACRLLGWEKDESSVIYGYKIKHGTCPIFINYHKEDDISQSTQYQDAFISQSLFHWYSKSNRTFKSKEIQHILNHRHLNISLPLFVKKDETEGSEFYYLGQVDVVEGSAQKQTMPSGDPVVTMDLKLHDPVPYSIYKYLTQVDLND